MIRNTSVLTNNSNLEHLFTICDFPTYMGCTKDEITSDIKTDLIFDICKDTGIIQLRDVLPLSITNPFPHNDSIGKTWELHNKNFLKFISKFSPKRIIELGGGSGKLAIQYLSAVANSNWTIFDKNYSGDTHPNLEIKPEWFDMNCDLGQYDAIIHSHLFEHLHDPKSFLEAIRQTLPKPAVHVFSVPNLYAWIKNKHANCLNFEHTLFLTEEIIDTLLNNSGFKIIDKKKYKDHSIFYACVPCTPKNIKFKNNYKKYKKLFENFISYNTKLVEKINNKIKYNKNVYLFGGHIFSQYFIGLNLNTTNIKCILDNSKLKQSHRLYGTELYVKSPSIIKNEKSPLVILHMGEYSNEIKSDIKKNINKNTKFI